MAEVQGGWKPEYDKYLPAIDSNFGTQRDGTVGRIESGLLPTPGEAFMIQEATVSGVAVAVPFERQARAA